MVKIERCIAGTVPDDFSSWVQRLASSSDCRAIAEVGAGARPLLDNALLEGMGIEDYLILDISSEELRKAPSGYRTQVADISEPDLPVSRTFDLVFSRMVNEHVSDGREMHTNCRRLLRRGGLALHVFPNLHYPPFLANRLMAEGISSGIVHALQPGRVPEGDTGKFPAYYSWCRRPSDRQIGRYASVGFLVREVRSYFGSRYLQRVPVLGGLERFAGSASLRFRADRLSSFSIYLLEAV